MVKKLDSKKLIFSISFMLLLSIISFFIYELVDGRLTLGAYNETWDGVSVAHGFEAGNGSSDNPYVIKSEEEFLYFKKIIEGDEYLNYQDKYYVLGDNLDFGNNVITSIGIGSSDEARIFKGNFDGAGYSLNNLKIGASSINGTNYYGLFSKTVNVKINNLNINNVTIEPIEESGKVVVGTLIGESSVDKDSLDLLSSYENISINNFEIKSSKLKSSDSSVSGFINNISSNTVVNNIYLKGKIDNSFDTMANVSIKSLSDTNNIVCDISSSTDKLYLELVDGVNFSNNYVVKSGKYYLDNKEVLGEDILSDFNESLDNEYYWENNDGVFSLRRNEDVSTVTTPLAKGFSFSMARSAAIPLHESGVVGDTIYINDLESDYNYYTGLNYTDYRDKTTLPDDTIGSNRNLYNSSNLVKVYIMYDGSDLNDSSVVGTVSTTEKVSKFVYYKYYQVKNGYIDLELIDSPYANRPNNKYFHGWATDYPGVLISHNFDEYLRMAKIPVSSGTTEISITFNAVWGGGKTYTLSTNTAWTTIDNNLEKGAMTDIGYVQQVYEPALTSVYLYTSISNGKSYPSGAKSATNTTLTGKCSSSTCYYYILNTSTTFSSSTNYYQLVNNSFSRVTVKLVDKYIDVIPKGNNPAGFFRKVHIAQYKSRDGYYSSVGIAQTGNCPTSGGCDLYQLMQYYDDSGNVNSASGEEIFYRLVTRDTNVVVLEKDITGAYSITPSRPLTITSINNGSMTKRRYELSTTGYILPTADVRIEYITLDSGVSSSVASNNVYTNSGVTKKTNQRGVFYGNLNNIKIGRGVTRYNSNYTSPAILGAANANAAIGGSTYIHRYRTIVESGYYNYAAIANSGACSNSACTTSVTVNVYIDSTMVWGSDYDRIVDDDTNALEVTFATAGTWNGNVRTDSDGIAFHTIVKSGRIGTSKKDVSTGLYVGDRNVGSRYAAVEAVIEGGWIYSIIGGPSVASTRTNYNDTYINMKGGTADFIFGGAGTSTTYGNRIVSVTGGKVNYSVFGGSNGSTGSSSDGMVKGSSLIYIGGNAIIGDDSLISANSTQFGAEAGSVFGIGNGNTNSASIGSMTKSYIIIDGASQIKRNVYGGGNYGTVGTSTTTSSVIDILNGNIAGGVYGGGNNNGSGTGSIASTININMSGGQVGYIYGGARSKGIVYGTTAINITKGNILHDVYGGGEGGYTNSTNLGTYVRNNVSVVIGSKNASNNNVKINGNVYGGSAYGTVNAINQTATSSTSTTNVTVNSGVVVGNVFGGAKGSSKFTPKVLGNITVNINGGSIGNVFGGMDASGQPNASDIVYLNGGVIGNAYGGGNNASQNVTDIRLQGSEVKDLFGGSNLLGTVTKSNVTFTSGEVNNIYGGNNKAGLTENTNVTVRGVTTKALGTGNVSEGRISGDIYGGGNEAQSTNSNVVVTSSTVNNIYGGGKQAGLTTSLVNLSSVTAPKVFGGSNISGNVGTTNVNVESGVIELIYGGGNEASVGNTKVNVDVVSVGEVYGGGNKAAVNGKTFLDIDGTQVSGNVYGGGNEGVVSDSTEVFVTDANILGNVYAGGNGETAVVHKNSTVTIDGNTVIGSEKSTAPKAGCVFGSGNAAATGLEDVRNSNASVNIVSGLIYGNVYGGGNEADVSGKTLLDIDEVQVRGSIYGGGNAGDVNGKTILDIDGVQVRESVYGGGNAGDVSENTFLDINGAEVNGSIYGGGNEGVVFDSTEVFVTDTSILGNVYGGGNAADVSGKTLLDIDGVQVRGSIYGGGNEGNVNGSTFLDIDGTQVKESVYGGGNEGNVSENTFLDIDGAEVNGSVYGGGNEGVVFDSTEVFVTDTSILENVYAGGNGVTAVVHKNSAVTIDGNTVVGSENAVVPNAGCVFGSGNAAATGLEDGHNSKASVNIVGGLIYGNVYGGPKMSQVFGTSETNVGSSAVSNNKLNENDIIIKGTVFGGGESNADGSDKFDWTFISITEGITVNINGNGYIARNHEFVINGSIFGSGNASSSSGESIVNIKDLGTRTKPNKSISIQRANKLVIDSSVIELEGITDSTNDYSDIKYSLNIIDLMIIKNNTTLLLQHNANLLKELYSGVDKNGSLVPATVDIDADSKKVTKNVDNRIYMIPNQNLNVTINQAATAYGKVTGMSFFGMYNSYANGSYRFGLYDSDVSYGDSGSAGMVIIGGSYVLGLHSVNHDITKDGFYSNYLDDAYTEVTTDYIDPTTIGETGYRWVIGLAAINYNFTLTASKYSSLGTYELQMIDFADGDTNFNVIGFNSEGLSDGVSLVDSSLVPRVGKTEDEANKVLGLAMKAETQEWTSHGTTKMFSDNNGKYSGDDYYKTDSRKLPPSLMFYLYHAKNITLDGDLGTVVIMLQAAIPTSAIDYKIQLITITIDLVARQYDDADSYDASITYDKRYEMPSSTSVNITNKSQFSAYYALIVWNDDFEEIYGKNNSNFHVLTTNTPLPVGTMITMIDFCGNERRPEYYYYTITEDVYNDSIRQLATYNEITYRLSNFVKMGSTSMNNTYDDKVANRAYYSEEIGIADEEFMFIFDMKDSTRTEDYLNNTMLFELRNFDERTVYNVLGIRQNVMQYSTYGSSNAYLNQTIDGLGEYIYHDVTTDINYSTEIQYNQTQNRESVIDTNYESSSMGLNVSLYDKDGLPVSSSLLTGTSIVIDKKEYFADSDGVFRIKLAGKVSNINRSIALTTNKDLPAGVYTMKYTLFASDDGLHNSDIANSVTDEFIVNVVGSLNSIVAKTDYHTMIVNGETSLNLEGQAYNTYTVKYNAELSNPNLRVEVYKRDVSNANSTIFESVSFHALFRNNLLISSGNEVRLDMGNLVEKEFNFNLEKELVSGTYKVVFRLYDNNQLIDDDIKYVIVKKNSE